MKLFNRGPSRLERQLAAAALEDAIGRTEALAPVRLEVGTRITAVTEGGTAVAGTVSRIYQAPRDVAADVFRFACEPAGDGSSDERDGAST